MATLNITVKTRKPVDLGVTPGGSTLNRQGRDLFRRALNTVVGQIGDSQNFSLAYSSVSPVSACAAAVISGGAGAVGATLNGVTVTDTWATSDTNSAALAAAAINASSNALVLGFVRASNLRMTITSTSAAVGDAVEVCGTRFVAVSGTVPAISSMSGVNTFDISGNDAADAAALAVAINSAQGLSNYVFALAVSNVCYVFARQFTYAAPTFSWPTGPGVPPNFVQSFASTLALSGSTLAASANFGVCACVPGILGNAVTIAASGTGVSILNASARLAGGAGGNVVPVLGQS